MVPLGPLDLQEIVVFLVPLEQTAETVRMETQERQEEMAHQELQD